MQASDGNFYGTTTQGGKFGYGTVFKMTQSGIVSVLYNFQGLADAVAPYGGVIQATDGNLYGTTNGGGSFINGTIFQITTGGTYKKLYNFVSDIGRYPMAALVQHTDGVLYGTASGGGKFGWGSVFSLNMGLAPFVALVSYTGKIGGTAQILGQGLTGTTSVTFNTIPAARFTLVSDTYMIAVVPSGATTGPVVVTTPTGTLTSNRNFQVLQ